LDIYAKNLNALSQVDPQLYKLLELTDTNEIFEVFLSDNSSVENANVVDKRDGKSIYENDVSLEIKDKVHEFEKYDNYPVLYFFGIGNGSFFKELLKNPKHQELMVIEPELELIYIVLNLIDLSEEILSKRIIIKLSVLVNRKFFIDELKGMKKFFAKSYDFHVYSNFYDKYQVEIQRVNKEIVDAFKHSMYIVGNSAKDALIGLEYSLKNMKEVIENPPFTQLTANAKNTKTAVIVSTGPSLAKQLDLLKEIQDHVTILCIDASFPILARVGIKPDIVFSIERVSLTGKFYENTPKEFHKNVIFALASVCHDETINNIHGQKCFFMRADSYNVYFGLDRWGYLGGGQSSANFAYDFAVKSEFENIIIIGQDLAYAKDGRSHSKDHVFGEEEVKSDKEVGEVEAYGGVGRVKTTKVWSAFLNAFVTQIAGTNIPTINATEGGARIEGSIEMSFRDAIEKCVDKSIDKELISVSSLSQEEISKSLQHFYSRVGEAISIGKSMQKQSEKLYSKIDKTLQKSSSENSIDKLLDSITEVKNKYNSEEFTGMYANLLNGYVTNHEYEVADVYVMRDNTQKAKLSKKIAWLKVHQEWLYRVYTNLEAVLELLEKSK